MNGWLVALALVAAYVTFVVWIIQTGRLARWNLSLMLGIVLMIRTQHGKGLIEAIARPRRLWNAFADFGIGLTLVGMALMTFVFIAISLFVAQPDSGVEPLSAAEILVIPGVNPFVPLWYGILALIFTLVVHEGGHGVLARANGMRVKSIGLLVAVVPIGAFVEPDEDDLRATTRRKRLRVFAAGPLLNFAFAALFLAAFLGGVNATQPESGAWYNVTKDGPAEEADLPTIGSIVRMDAVPVADWAGFQEFMRETKPLQEVLVTVDDGSTYPVTLSDRWTHLAETDKQRIFSNNTHGRAYCSVYLEREVEDGPACAAALQGSAFLGVNQVRGAVELVKHPFSIDCDGSGLGRFGCEMQGLAYLAYLPIGEVRGTPFLSVYFPEFHDAPVEPAVFWPLVTLCFWIFWINLMVGLTNILPMLPLDGGHIFRDAVGGAVATVAPRAAEETQARWVNRASLIVSLIILGAFLLQIFGPYLVKWLGA